MSEWESCGAHWIQQPREDQTQDRVDFNLLGSLGLNLQKKKANWATNISKPDFDRTKIANGKLGDNFYNFPWGRH